MIVSRTRAVASALIGALAITLVAAQPSTQPTAYDRQQDARIAALESQLAGQPSAIPSPSPSQSSSPSSAAGWTLAFEDTFDRTVALGHLMDGSPDGYHTADGRYVVYKSSWTDTSHNGHYDPAIASIANGIFDVHLQWLNGAPHVFAMTALPAGSTAKGGLVSMRCEVRIRADRLVGYKGVPMCGWADAATTNDLLLQYGENDFPESNFDQSPAGFMHYTDVQKDAQGKPICPCQDWYPTGVSWQDWHTYVVEWRAGQSVEFFVDGRSIGRSTSRIPTVAMHHNEQFETWTNGVLPDPAVNGHVQIDSIRIWRWA